MGLRVRSISCRLLAGTALPGAEALGRYGKRQKARGRGVSSKNGPQLERPVRCRDEFSGCVGVVRTARNLVRRRRPFRPGPLAPQCQAPEDAGGLSIHSEGPTRVILAPTPR